MRVRVVLGLAVIAVATGFIIDMSGRAPRTAGSNHTSPIAFVGTVPRGGTLCQPAADLPDNAARVQMLIGSYGRPLPVLRVDFFDAANNQVASGQLSPGGREGLITIPLRRTGRVGAAASSACLHVGGSHQVALGGEAVPANPSSEVINGSPQPGRVSLLYVRQGTESWWSLLPELTRRFGLGKASLFGTWTLPAVALLLLGVWAAAVRLLVRELT